tara:strand:- start:232 stop:585 length:354 start_codon:yes stop_codon:yes gene_type:complete
MKDNRSYEATEYFRLFSEKNLEGLDKMFDEKATLRDWSIEAEGKINVFIAMKQIFDSVERIAIKVINMWQDENKPNTLVAEIDIISGNDEKAEEITVVDIIEFNNEGKIRAIRAFKG